MQELLKSENPKLESQVKMYYEKSHMLVEKTECYSRVIGDQLLERMRNVYKLGIFLNDMQDLVKLCKGEPVEGQ